MAISAFYSNFVHSSSMRFTLITSKMCRFNVEPEKKYDEMCVQTCIKCAARSSVCVSRRAFQMDFWIFLCIFQFSLIPLPTIFFPLAFFVWLLSVRVILFAFHFSNECTFINARGSFENEMTALRTAQCIEEKCRGKEFPIR